MSDATCSAHCWHQVSSSILTCYPPIEQRTCVCCRCGARVRQALARRPLPGHGPYLPRDEVETWWTDVGEVTPHPDREQG